MSVNDANVPVGLDFMKTESPKVNDFENYCKSTDSVADEYFTRIIDFPGENARADCCRIFTQAKSLFDGKIHSTPMVVSSLETYRKEFASIDYVS